jgi:hypothetical protein
MDLKMKIREPGVIVIGLWNTLVSSCSMQMLVEEESSAIEQRSHGAHLA